MLFFIIGTPKNSIRHCGLDPQSPCSLQGIPHCVRNDGGVVPSATLRHRCVSGSERNRTAGLPRRSYLTARNDDVPFYSHVSRHCGLDPQSPANDTSPTLSKGEEEHGLGMLYSVFRASAAPSPLERAGGEVKIIVQTKKTKKKSTFKILKKLCTFANYF